MEHDNLMELLQKRCVWIWANMLNRWRWEAATSKATCRRGGNAQPIKPKSVTFDYICTGKLNSYRELFLCLNQVK